MDTRSLSHNQLKDILRKHRRFLFWNFEPNPTAMMLDNIKQEIKRRKVQKLKLGK